MHVFLSLHRFLFLKKMKELVIILFRVGFLPYNKHLITKLGWSVWGNLDLDLGTDLTVPCLY